MQELLYSLLSLSLSAFAVKPADVRSQSFKSNVTVMVYAAITEAIKVPKWKIRSHLSSWEKYIVWRFLDSVFFFFFPRTSAKCFCGFIYHDTSRLFSHSGVNSYFSPTADDSSHIHLLSLLCPPPPNTTQLIMLSHNLRMSAGWPRATSHRVTQSNKKKKKAEDVNYPGMCKNGIFIIAATMGDFK